jgi:hypothetical protein
MFQTSKVSFLVLTTDLDAMFSVLWNKIKIHCTASQLFAVGVLVKEQVSIG